MLAVVLSRPNRCGKCHNYLPCILTPLQNTYDVEILTSEDGIEWRDEEDVIFVVEDFNGPQFRYLSASGKRILGPTVIFQSYAANKVRLAFGRIP